MQAFDGGSGDALHLHVGGLTRDELRAQLSAAGVLLNAYAETLLDHAMFARRAAEELTVVLRSVADLGFTGATLAEVFAAAQDLGLALCPPDTGPYLRLALMDQANAPDSVLSRGRSPAGAIKIASAPLTDDVAYPKGFYLRVVDHQPWLRGYRCDGEYRFGGDDRFAFRAG